MQNPNVASESLTFVHPPTSIWRVGMWWLALGGPLLVAVASIATLMLALQGGDPTRAPRSAAQAVQVPSAAKKSGAADVPAVQARNHAATATQTR
jgi:uncharacterized protein